MDKRFSTVVATGAVVVLPLLTGCGAGTARQGSSAAPVAPAASSAGTPSTATAASPSPSPSSSSTPADDTASVKAVSRTFVTDVFGYDSSTSYAAYRDRIEPLMTKGGFETFEAAHFEQATQKFRSRYGTQARTRTTFRGAPKVVTLTGDHATVSVAYENRVEQRRDGKWRTVKRGVDDSVKVPLVKQGSTWLVDELS